MRARVMQQGMLFGTLCLIGFPALGAALTDKAQPAVVKPRLTVENKYLKLVVKPRTAQQMAAFYEGRGFPRKAIAAINKACFFTVGIRNHSNKILWLDTGNWRFHAHHGEEIQRITRADWKQTWQQMGIALRYQSTFRWTLLPATLGFQPDEREGGNITLPRSDQPFSFSATFTLGDKATGQPVTVQLDNLQCAE